MRRGGEGGGGPRAPTVPSCRGTDKVCAYGRVGVGRRPVGGRPEIGVVEAPHRRGGQSSYGEERGDGGVWWTDRGADRGGRVPDAGTGGLRADLPAPLHGGRG